MARSKAPTKEKNLELPLVPLESQINKTSDKHKITSSPAKEI